MANLSTGNLSAGWIGRLASPTMDEPTAGQIAWRPLLVGASTLAVLGVTFLPWAASGEVERNSYALAEVADRSEVLPDSAERLIGVWMLVPLACGVVLTLLVTRRHRIASLLLCLVALTVTGLSILVDRSPLPALIGANLAVPVGIAAVLGAVVLFVQPR